MILQQEDATTTLNKLNKCYRAVIAQTGDNFFQSTGNDRKTTNEIISILNKHTKVAITNYETEKFRQCHSNVQCLLQSGCCTK